ncbi:MAG: ACT domain-containing protein [Nocardioides sp.]|jgi:ACT domain-containing protein
MPFLLRVELPDVPGSLGRLATAIGEARGDIEAIEIIEKRHDGTALDDVLLETEAMPDSIVSACNALEGVQVVWISRYAAGGNLVMDLEAVEEITAKPQQAVERLVDMLPKVFRVDWGARVHRAKGVVHGTTAAPPDLPFTEIEGPTRIDGADEVTLYAAARLDGNEIIVVGRRGGPDFVDSEIARLGHLTGLAHSIAEG